MHVDFRIIRLLEKHLVASDCQLDMEIDIVAGSDPTMAKDRLKAMKFWVETFLDGSLAFGVNTTVDTSSFESISNNIVMCPDDPHDYLLLLLMHSKLSAIGGPEISVGSMNLISDTGEGFSNSIDGFADEWLPSMSEWMGDRHFHERPWWGRDDSSTIDLHAEPDDDLSVKPELGVDLMALVRSTPSSIQPAERPAAEIIKPQFKPRVLTPDD